MDSNLLKLINAIKVATSNLKPQHNPLSFILMTGKNAQGKTALLRQTQMNAVSIDIDDKFSVFYNNHGIIVEISEHFLHESPHLLKDIFKQLNRCHNSLKINGLGLCVDLNELITADTSFLRELCQTHAQLLQRFEEGIGYPLDLAIFFTKTDGLSGFSEFFQYDHSSELSKPLGFSLPNVQDKKKLSSIFNLRFEQFIESLNQQVINKMHPARSSIKRSLIREFPLQLASLRAHIHIFLQSLPNTQLSLQALYFTSAEQGGISIDHLNKRIGHEYGLAIQEQFIQANNFKAYFIEGALLAFQEQSKRPLTKPKPQQRYAISALAVCTGLGLAFVLHQHQHTSTLLDQASKDLLHYENLINQDEKMANALQHLNDAKNKLAQVVSHQHSKNIVELSKQLNENTKENIQAHFVPKMLSLLEQNLTANHSSAQDRFSALKIYLSIANPKHHDKTAIADWFKTHWPNKKGISKKELALITEAFTTTLPKQNLNTQLISDVRNYLNALPAGFLFYSLAKKQFPSKETPLHIVGFNLAQDKLPVYYTKSAYQNVIAQIPKIANELQTNNWVLNRQDLDKLAPLLEQAYNYDYVSWWQNLMQKSRPVHFEDCKTGSQITRSLAESQALTQFLTLIQKETGPNLKRQDSNFNQAIASQFTDLNLLSKNIEHDLNVDISELNRFLSTLSVVNDGGRTAFNIAKARFSNRTISDPLSALYTRAQQLPEPLAAWSRQLADDTWTLLIQQTRAYINLEWKQLVYDEYLSKISGRYPFENQKQHDVNLNDFERFFSKQGLLNQFQTQYLKPFLNTETAEWTAKELNGYMLPISKDSINEFIRANVISNMFFQDELSNTKIQFSLQKLNLDPVIANLALSLGHSTLNDNQRSESITEFSWPQDNVKLAIDSIEGNHYEIEEKGPWALFRLFEKMNVVVDEHDSSSLEVLLDINGYAGRYLLRTQSQINPFIPGILNGFQLPEHIV